MAFPDDIPFATRGKYSTYGNLAVDDAGEFEPEPAADPVGEVGGRARSVNAVNATGAASAAADADSRDGARAAACAGSQVDAHAAACAGSRNGAPSDTRRRAAFARFRELYASRDGAFVLFEDEHGHLAAVDASKLA